jgi:Tol biopolymer transport system component
MAIRTHSTTLAATAATVVVCQIISASWAASSTAGSDATSPRLASNGRIVTSAVGPDYIVSILPDGSDRRRIHKFPKGTKAGEIDVSASGSQIVGVFGQNSTRSQIYTVNSDGTHFKQITQGRGGHSGPTYSPSGGRIAFERNVDGSTSLNRMRADGSTIVQLTQGAEPAPDEEAFVPEAWAPDGALIAFIADSREGRSIVLTDTKGTWFRYLRTFPHARGNLWGLNWSSDSSTIVFSRGNRRNSGSDLWALDKDGSNLTRITDTPNRYETSPAYSPDGSAIACSLSPISYKWADVLVMDADGSNRTRIETPRAMEYDLAWGG